MPDPELVEVTWERDHLAEPPISWRIITGKRYPKWPRSHVPRELFDRYAAAKREYNRALDALQRAEVPHPRQSPVSHGAR